MLCVCVLCVRLRLRKQESAVCVRAVCSVCVLLVRPCVSVCARLCRYVRVCGSRVFVSLHMFVRVSVCVAVRVSDRVCMCMSLCGLMSVCVCVRLCQCLCASVCGSASPCVCPCAPVCVRP